MIMHLKKYHLNADVISYGLYDMGYIIKVYTVWELLNGLEV